MILLLLSDQYGCSALFSPALSSLITTSSSLSSLLLVRVTSCASPVLTSFVTSPVLVSWSVLAVTLGIVSWVRLAVGLRSCTPDTGRRLKGVVSDPALCPAKFSFEAPIRDDRRHWPSSVSLSFLGPWSHVVQLPRPVHDKFFDQPPAVVRTQTSRLSARLQLFSGMLRCELAIVLVQFLSTGHLN